MAASTPPKEHQFKPGESGNPKGRPASKRVKAALRHLKPKALEALKAAVEKGEPWAVTLWFHYTYGKPVDQVQLSGKDGEALSVSVVINRTVKDGGEDAGG